MWNFFKTFLFGKTMNSPEAQHSELCPLADLLNDTFDSKNNALQKQKFLELIELAETY